MTGSALSNAPLWGGAGAVAIAVHLVLVQQGIAAYIARNEVPPPATIPQIEIMAMASSVAGEEQPVETARAVQSQTLSAASSVDRPTAARVQSVDKASSAAAQRLTAVEKPEDAPQSPASVLSAVVPRAPTATATSSVTPSRPKAPSALAVRSTASIAAKSVGPDPGLAPPALAPVALGVETLRPSATPAPEAPMTVTALPATSVRRMQAAPRANAAPSKAITAVAPTRSAPVQAIAPVMSPSDTLAALPPPPIPSLPPAADVPEQVGIAAPQPTQTPKDNLNTYQSVLDVLASLPKSPCFAALPTLSDESAFRLEVFAQTPAELDQFADDLTARIGQTPNSTMKAISAAQCAVAAFVTEGPAYPRFKLFFDVPLREIESGGALEGRIGNTSGGFISFLIIDDEGVVQDLASFLQFVPGGARFRIPMSLTGSPVVTQQLLMAISSPSLLQTVISMNGTKSDAFFPALAAELREKGHSEDVALVAFSVK